MLRRLPFAVLLIAAPVLAQDTPENISDDGRVINPDNPNPYGNMLTPQPEPQPAAPAGEADAPAGKQFFLRAAETLRSATSISYFVRSAAVGGTLEGMMASLDATVVMTRPAASGEAVAETVWWVHARGTGRPRPSDPEINFDVAWLTQTAEWVDHGKKKVIEKRSREARAPEFNIANSARLEDFAGAEPFARELSQAETFTVEARQSVGGVECDVVLVENPTRRTQSRWYFAVTDGLPRKIERIFNQDFANGTLATELSSLTVDTSRPPRITSAMARVTVPEGYTEERTGVPRGAPPPVQPGATPQGNQPVTPNPAQPINSAPPVVQPAPAFEMSGENGAKLTNDTIKGQVAVIEFSGSWNLPARRARGDLNTLAERLGARGVKVYTAAVHEKNANEAGGVYRAAGFDGTLYTKADSAAAALGVRRFPAWVVIDAHGRVVHTEETFRPTETVAAIEAAVQRAVDEAPPPPDEATDDAAAATGTKE